MAALKAFSLFSLALLVILLIPLLSAHATNPPNSVGKKTSPFEFLKGLQGCHKGNKTKGIQGLKKYLEQFGYLSYNNYTHASDDDFDDLLESAVKTYQLNYHLNASGTLDEKTVSTMMIPRCGVPDIVNGTNLMHLGKKRHDHKSHGLFHTVSHYSFIPGEPKWPPSKYHLTYGFVPGTPAEAINAVELAFQAWASSTHFTFSQAPSGSQSDITIGFYTRDHGDGDPFDGPGGVLAHAFEPTDGRFHYDGDENWSVGAVQDAFDLETLAVHEIGHNLGLGHSEVPDAIMYPFLPSGATKGLHPDDIEGIRVLYNM